ncbi:MAG: hypothetical protein SNH27_12985 [Rikenellaceae bacterium]
MDYKTIDDFMSDTADALVQTALEQVPVVGFFVSAADKVKGAYLQRKYESWQELVNTRLSTLESSVFEQLGENETFSVAFMKATELAASSNQRKMELLANAVKYSAENAVKDDYLIIFLNCIARYTITHLIVLKYFQSPTEPKGVEGLISSSPMELFKKQITNIDKDVVTIAIQDLQRDGLMQQAELNGTMTKGGCLASRTTDMGNSFIDFFGIKDLSNE